MSFGFYEGKSASANPPIPLAMLLIVEEALRVAWQRLRDRAPAQFNLLSADEDVVTHGLYEILMEEVYNKGLVDGFDEEHFTPVYREPKLRNFDGKHPDKMPDLHVGLAGRSDVFMRTQDGLFIECKPVDATHTVGTHYGALGIARFIQGDYAWALVDALMIGYVSAGYSLNPKLFEALRDRAEEFMVLKAPKACTRSKASAFSSAVHITTHGRKFAYAGSRKRTPPIRLRHLWLNRY